MAILQVREIPIHIYEKLKEEASREHRSIAQQATISLAKGLKAELNPKEKRQCVIKEIQMLNDQTMKYDLSDPVELIREDRKR